MNDLKQKENSWNTTERDLGYVTPGTTYKVEFEYTGSKQIQMVTTQCGCTNASIKGNIISTEYTPKEKPAHITGERPISKKVTVKFRDGSSDRLYITAKIA